MISEEIKKLDVFGKKDRLEKILNLDFMSEELLEALIKDYPPFTGKINGNVKDLTAVDQDEYIKAHPELKHDHDEGYLVALYILEDQKQSGHKSWLCWNKRTQDIYGNVETYNFTNGHVNGGGAAAAGKSYASLGNSRMDQRTDLTGKTFGYIDVIKKTGNRQVGDARLEYLCHCNACGKDFVKDSHTLQKMTHCGCKNPLSKDMVLIEKFFIDNNIEYRLEQKFDDCRDINSLPFDIAIKGTPNYLIEYDGEQHFKEVPGKFDSEEDNFKTRHEHDLTKNQYCFDHKIPLIRIPFDADWTEDDLKLETTRYLLTPENEMNYYLERMK